VNPKINTKFEKVCVLGLGYVGLPTAAIIASQGITVTGFDVDKKTVETINGGRIHIVEPGLDVMVQNTVTNGYLRATNSIETADVFIIAVPTPLKKDNKPDLRFLEQAVRNLSSVLSEGNLVILESTSPVGTTRQICNWLSELRPDLNLPLGDEKELSEKHNIFIAHSPERILPGRVLIELVNNDRVIGGLSNTCSERAKEFYSLFVDGKCHVTNAQTAELVKLAENAFRDTNIAFANEMSLVCDKLEIDVWEMIDLANLHPRVDILRPGPGVGGHCIAVDPWFIVNSAREQTPLIQASRKVNNNKPNWVVERAIETTNSSSPIACLGLSYKSDIDDLRESPAVGIVEKIATNHLGKVFVAEPNIIEIPPHFDNHKNIEFCHYERAIDQADTIIILTDHKEFKLIDKSSLKNKKVIDTRGIWHKT